MHMSRLHQVTEDDPDGHLVLCIVYSYACCRMYLYG